MEDLDLIEVIKTYAQGILTGLPLYIVWIVGLVQFYLHKKRNISISILFPIALAGFFILSLLIGFLPYLLLQALPTWDYKQVTLLYSSLLSLSHALLWGLIIFSVFAGREK